MTNPQENYRAVCCSECFTYLATRNTKAAGFWLDLCTNSLKGSLFSREDELAFLEKERFIVTSEDTMSDSYLQLKLNGYYRNDEDEELFCLHLEEHGHGEEFKDEEDA